MATPLFQAAVEYGMASGESARLARFWQRFTETATEVWSVIVSNPVVLVACVIVLGLLLFRSPARR